MVALSKIFFLIIKIIGTTKIPRTNDIDPKNIHQKIYFPASKHKSLATQVCCAHEFHIKSMQSSKEANDMNLHIIIIFDDERTLKVDATHKVNLPNHTQTHAFE